MSIKAILYSKFDPQEGPKIVHQVPDGTVLPSSDLSGSQTNLPSVSTHIGNHTAALLSFPNISRFLIPRQSLCNNLISITPPPLTPSTPSVLILSYPVCIQSPRYPRNEFIFTFSLLLSPPDSVDVPAYKSVITKLAQLMRSLEEQSSFLSSDTSAPGTGKIYSLCEMVMEDLNNYAECMIPIDDVNTLNMKLFPTLPNPARVLPWHVPLFAVKIESLMDSNWDLTMTRIIPFINGVNSVKRISTLADADLKLTQKCVRHLLYYGCVLLLDIFSFRAIYAPTSEFTAPGMIAQNAEMQAECARYVNTAFAPTVVPVSVVAAEAGLGLKQSQGANNTQTQTAPQGNFEQGTSTANDGVGSSSMRSSVLGTTAPNSTGGSGPGYGLALAPGMEEDIWPLAAKGVVLDGVSIVQLYARLQQGLSVREWYTQNANQLANIDLRRFITFGVIKGFLYRIHRYAVQTTEPKTHRSNAGGAGGSTAGGFGLHTSKPSSNIDATAATINTTGTVTRKAPKADKKRWISGKTSMGSGGGGGSRSNKTSASTSTNNSDSGHDHYQDDDEGVGVGVGDGDGDSRGDIIDDDDDDENDDVAFATDKRIKLKLQRFLDGTHCFDEICTTLGISEKTLMTLLARPEMGEVVVICR